MLLLPCSTLLEERRELEDFSHHCEHQKGKVTHENSYSLLAATNRMQPGPLHHIKLLIRVWRSPWNRNRGGCMCPFALGWQNKINCLQGTWEIDINISGRSKSKIFKCCFKRMLDHLRMLILNRRITEAAYDLSSLFATGIRTKCHILGPCFMFASTRTDNLNVSYYSLSINFRI